MSTGMATRRRHARARDDGVSPDSLPLGAAARDDGAASFLLWAPLHDHVLLRLHDSARDIPLRSHDGGYHYAIVRDVAPGTRYSFVVPDGRALPDPASRGQPDGVHGPSELVLREFAWQVDRWRTPALRHMVIYELHVGTFTPEGTFDGVIGRLDDLRALGVTAIELMPVAQFPGGRNWGYDGVYAFAAQNTYGGAAGLKRLVDAAHARDIAVVLDVVYNHLGPEGNYLPAFGPCFTDTYHTPWGAALNFDEGGSDEVRRYFIESALQWVDEFRIDALRLDAVHAILDRSALPFLRELADAVHARARELGRSVVLIAESDLGDPRMMRSAREGGYCMDAQWLDDFHHSLRALLTGESAGYYADFGTLEHLARAYRHGYVYDGQYSQYRGRRHGAPGPDIAPARFVVYTQNHDQIGNRMIGDRPISTLTPAQVRLAAAAMILSPFTPMLFMGEEYGERRPFPYFVSHGDAALVEAVRTGRGSEFAAFAWAGEPPDPQAEETFNSAVLDWDARSRTGHAELLTLYRRLLELRASTSAIGAGYASVEIYDTAGRQFDGADAEGVLLVRMDCAGSSALLALNFAAAPVTVPLDTASHWRVALDTAAEAFGGTGSDRPMETSDTHALLDLESHSAILLIRDDASA